MNCNNQEIETAYLGDIAIDNLTSLPDYFLTERDIEDEETGDVVRAIVRTPVAKIVPNGNYDNQTMLETNNTALDSLEEDGDIDWKTQVLAGYVSNEGSTIVMHPSDASHAPMFIMLGEITPGGMMIQNTGFITLNKGHQYIVGTQYYADENGYPTTDSTTGYKLFIPISHTKLAVNLGA